MCGPSAHTPMLSVNKQRACVNMGLRPNFHPTNTINHVENISSGPLAHKNGQILAILGHFGGNSDLFWTYFSHFGLVLAILEVFLTELEKMNKMKKLHMTLEDVEKKLFLFSYLYS